MVQFCVKKCTELKYQHAFNIIEASVSNLPFPDNSFSMIYVRSVIHHWAEPKKGLQELCCVLDRGGRIIIHDPLADSEETALVFLTNHVVNAVWQLCPQKKNLH